MDNSKVLPIVQGKLRYEGAETMKQWLGTEPVFDRVDVVLETDVVVCGGGLSGVSACRAATELGADVILLEKTNSIQCRMGDFGTIGSKVAEHWGRSGTEYKEAIIASFMKSSGYWPRHPIIKYWADHSGEDLDWYISAKPDLYILTHTTDPVPEGIEAWIQPARYPLPEDFCLEKEYYPCYQITAQLRPDQAPVLKAHFDKAMETGRLRAFFETPAQKLITEDGQVRGVVARNYDGTVYEVHARKGVVLATGDYSGNLDMMNYYCPWLKDNPHIYPAVDPEGYLADTGDGHRMGMWAGAAMELGPHAPNIHNMGGPMGVAAFLQINTEGRRFMNEDTFGQQIENQLAMQPGRITWQIFDSSWPVQVTAMSPGHGSACMVVDDDDMLSGKINPTLSQADGYVSRGSIQDAIDMGKVFCADTMEELFKLIGVPEKQAMETVSRYNALARQGHDDDFGKTAERMFEIKDGPFYAAKITPAPLLVCMSGLDSDEYARCKNAECETIPGLYVCGNVQGGRFAVEYPTTVPGMSHSMALTFGRRAGISAAQKL